MTTSRYDLPHSAFARLLEKFPDLAATLPAIEHAYTLLEACYHHGGQVLICGNGGSAADSEHVVGELMKGYLQPRPVPADVRQALMEAYPDVGSDLASRLQGALPAISLVSQTALLSAIANDVSADMVYAQQVYGYGRHGDVLIGISTSGNALNVLNAVRVARVRGLHTIGFTGSTGGALRGLAEIAVCASAEKTADIQERHLAIYHAICARLEEAIFAP
jgi:D-sedoheptulose 7-phosphate isomerase